MKKTIILLLILALPGMVMADSKMSAYTTSTTAAETDMIPVLYNYSTTSVNRIVSVTNFRTLMFGNAFITFTGPTTTMRTFTLPDSNATLLYSGGALGTPASGTLTNCTFPTLNQNTTGTSAGLSGTPNITVGTISAGSAGFSVDADGDVTAKSVTVSKVSGTAGLASVYEANSTDTSYIGWMGPASISESFSYQFSNTQPTAGQAMVFAAPTGTGDPNGQKVSAQTWITPIQLVAKGTAALGTSEIASGACASAVDGTVTAGTGANIATTDVIDWGFNGDPTSTTGYSASANGMLTIIAYPTSGHAYFKVCNNTASAITPGSVTLNWKVTR